ncbi:MAG: helix-turn-helix transcriptional regulator [Cyanophyceae cyanobacterium]
MINTDRLLTIKEVCVVLGISRSSVYNLLNSGKLLQPLHINKSTRWRLSDIQHFIEAGATVTD